ncbi:xanthine dehydrogenase family protein molybdopterin-binding subunit [Nitratireductor aquimarinus]|uniref:xanthine dehydrogenase family protein molybdopterin-binding subunit n=1 Tax=Nitratireductor aquimarinus TaxID=889300 RepID=UPI002935B642|nr:xanthine dehydrogenase family protein molybdopterin-binding subunit [Nitratireductor aquimarinus]MDV2967581.1 xanthine dehydrogenase family protein molybdopterin-binding subunit [Nitratireductor aquimarinus]
MDIGENTSARKDAWLGRSLLRVEDMRLVRGGGQYVDDLLPEGCLFLEFVRSPYPCGEIVALDVEAARRAEGVVAVLTADDLGDLGASAINLVLADMGARPLRPLAKGVVEATGQAVAAIIATSLSAARDAAQSVFLDVEPSEGGSAAAEAEIYAHHHTDGDVDAAFEQAAHIVTVSVEHALVAPTALEPRATLADWSRNTLTVWASTQTPFRVREDLARILDLPLAQVRVVAPDVGGAFGGKSSIYPEDVVVAWAARHLKAPVKWCATRGEELLAATQGRGARSEGELALSADGVLLGLRARLAFQLGHWMPYSAAIPGRNASRILPGPYRVQAMDIDLKGYRANRAAVGIYRGAGRPEAAMLLERLMDAAAKRLKIDPLELRRRNVIEANSFPYTTPTGQTLDSGDYGQLLDRMRSHAGYEALLAQRDERRAAGEVVGLGLALYIEPCGQGWESADVNFCRNGMFQVLTGASAQGQGRETAFAQIAADMLQVPPDRIAVRQGDTDDLSGGIGALASRGTAIGGSAVVRACEMLRGQLTEIAAGLFQCDPEILLFTREGISAGVVGAASISWNALADHVAGEAPGPALKPLLTGSVVYHAEGEAWSSGCCLAFVSINPRTGAPTFEKLSWVDDAGRVVNPMLVRGQLVGGMAQGLGEALMERIVYDDDGQLLTGSLMDYAVPRAIDIPAVDIAKLETVSPANALGAKGVGEAGCIGVPAAIFNAVSDAVAPFGPHKLQMPLTSETIWRALPQEWAQAHPRQRKNGSLT